MADNPKKKITVAAVCSLLLVAMVVALLFNKEGEAESEGGDVSASQKAITTICQNTDYQDTCVDSLESSGTNSSDPKELIQIAFQATIKQIKEAIANSSTTLLKDVEKDPRGKAALETCRQLANHAVDDLQRSFSKFKDFDLSEDADEVVSDLQIWLSGAITYQETCLDSFEGVEGDAGNKMRQFLNSSMQMSSNALAMVDDISQVIQSMISGGGGQNENVNNNNRRLLSENLPPIIVGRHDDDELLPNWVDFNKRRLLLSSTTGGGKIKPHIVVAKDGSGQYKTINKALEHVPTDLKNHTYIIYIKEGVYNEKIEIKKNMKRLMFVGDGPTKTRITGKLNYAEGTNTWDSATFAVKGDHFIAKDIGFENSAGAKGMQAVAARVSSDMSIFYNCHLDGYQDTLYSHTYRQFYKNCQLSGTIDFIFGDSAALFQGCTFVLRKPLEKQQCIVAAQGRLDIRQPTGFVLQNCSIVADPAYKPVMHKLKSYLARPWKDYSRTIIMESFIDDVIDPEGYAPWEKDFALKTLFYTEFNNRGPGSKKTHRLKWPGIKELPAKRVERFTPNKFLDAPRWIPLTHIPYEGSFVFELPKHDPKVKYSPVVPEETKDLGNLGDTSLSTTSKASSSETKDDKDDSDIKSSDEDKNDEYDDNKSSVKDKDDDDNHSSKKDNDDKHDAAADDQSSKTDNDDKHAAAADDDQSSKKDDKDDDDSSSSAPAPHNDNVRESQISASPGMAPTAQESGSGPALSPVSQPEGSIHSVVHKLFFRGW